MAAGGGAMLLRSKQRPATTATAAQVSGGKPGAQPPHVRGQADALVTIEEFGDFECPPCAGLSRSIATLKQDYGARLRVIFRHFPLEKHQHALAAAYAAEAAGLQGRFWEMHDLLYQEQRTWHYARNVQPLFTGYAQRLGLDVERFQRDSVSEEAKARVAADRERAASLRITKLRLSSLTSARCPAPIYSPTACAAQSKPPWLGNRRSDVVSDHPKRQGGTCRHDGV
jgi:hypothetical protein